MKFLPTIKARLGLLTALFALGTNAVYAQPDIPANSLGCTTENCSLQDFEAVRDATETLYGDILLILSAHERPALRSNQNEWRRTARAQCNQAAPAGANLNASQASPHHACMIEQDLRRHKELRRWLMDGYTVE
ncbi:lysozyme inhibitor LprI family protein [Ottowia sp.]|uniref:lysozyme inhibitor LprI family protein n=1 Tax=Ottowia sp. TaxID=1898956 RepID=UPI003A883273